MNNFFGNLPPVVKNLLIINLIFFVGSMIFTQALVFLGSFTRIRPSLKCGQPVTYMFMHGSFSHIFSICSPW